MVVDGHGAPQPWGALMVDISAKAANFFELSSEEWHFILWCLDPGLAPKLRTTSHGLSSGNCFVFSAIMEVFFWIFLLKPQVKKTPFIDSS